MTEMTSPSQLSPDHQPHVIASSTPPAINPSLAHPSSTLPPSFVSSSSSSVQSAGQSSPTLTSSIRPSTKPLTSPTAAQSSTPSSPVCRPARNISTLPPASAFTPICSASPQSSSSHHLPSTPPSSQPPSPQVPQQAPRASCNQLSVSSSHNSLDGEVAVSDIYFVSPHYYVSVLWFLFETILTASFKDLKYVYPAGSSLQCFVVSPLPESKDHFSSSVFSLIHWVFCSGPVRTAW